jgi:hypothetical protein
VTEAEKQERQTQKELPISAASVVEPKTDQGHWLAQEVDVKNTSYGWGYH